MDMSQPYHEGVTDPTVTAQPGDRSAWILTSDEGWAYPSKFSVSTQIDGFTVVLLVLIADHGPQVCSMAVEHPQLALGEPITQRMLRKIPIDRLITDGLMQVRRPARVVNADHHWWQVDGVEGVWGGPTVREGRGSRTDNEQFAQVAKVYERAVREGRPPVRAVAEELGYSRSHAGRLVSQARTAGLLRPTSPGKGSAVPVIEPQPVEPGPATT